MQSTPGPRAWTTDRSPTIKIHIPTIRDSLTVVPTITLVMCSRLMCSGVQRSSTDRIAGLKRLLAAGLSAASLTYTRASHGHLHTLFPTCTTKAADSVRCAQQPTSEEQGTTPATMLSSQAPTPSTTMQLIRTSHLAELHISQPLPLTYRRRSQLFRRLMGHPKTLAWRVIRSTDQITATWMRP